MNELLDFTQEEYLAEKGINFQRYALNTDIEVDEYFEIVKNQAYRRIEGEINKRSVKRLVVSDLESFQVSALKYAIMDFIEYVLNAYDPYAFNGYNPDGSRIVLMPQFIIENLRANGLIWVRL